MPDRGRINPHRLPVAEPIKRRLQIRYRNRLPLGRPGGRGERVVAIQAQDSVLTALDTERSNRLADQASEHNGGVKHDTTFSHRRSARRMWFTSGIALL